MFVCESLLIISLVSWSYVGIALLKSGSWFLNSVAATGDTVSVLLAAPCLVTLLVPVSSPAPTLRHAVSLLSCSCDELWKLNLQSKGSSPGSQKKVSHVLRGHNSLKNGLRNKSRVIFEILRSSSFWWANLSFFYHGGLRKLGLKRVTPYLKTWLN